jgi:hypothetical protein
MYESMKNSFFIPSFPAWMLREAAAGKNQLSGIKNAPDEGCIR